MKTTDKINSPHKLMKPKAKINSPQPRKNQSIQYIPNPRFILVPFYGYRLRAVLDGEDILYLREDVFRIFDLREGPKWNRILYPNQRRTLLVPDGDGCATEHKVVNEAGFYKILSLRQSDLCERFNVKGGSLILDMSRTDKKLDSRQSDLFRKILGQMHAYWRKENVPHFNLDEWEMPIRGEVKTWLLK